MLNSVYLFCFSLIAMSAVLGVFRLIKGPSHSDRVVVFDLLASLLLGTCVLLALYFQDTIWMDVALTVALVAFVSTVGMAYFLEKIKEP